MNLIPRLSPRALGARAMLVIGVALLLVGPLVGPVRGLAAELSPKQHKQIAKLEKKLAKKQVKHGLQFGKLVAAQDALSAGQAQLVLAQGLGDSTPADAKAKKKALKKATKKVNGAGKKIAKWSTKLDKNELAQAAIVDLIEAIDPEHFGSIASAGPSLAAVGDEDKVVFEWTPVEGASHYVLYWSLAPGVSPETGTPRETTNLKYGIAGVGDETEVFGVVAAFVDAVASTPSNEASAASDAAAPPPPPPPPPPGPTQYDPTWGDVAPGLVLTFDHDGGLSDVQNGANLKSAIQALQPGDRLEIGSGTYSINSFFRVELQGTSNAPIWIVAQAGAVPVITRPDANQNVINVGTSTLGSARYVAFRGLEFTGGSAGIRIYGGDNIWIDDCHIHHVGEAGITANSADSQFLHITRNEIHHTAGYGEGMYLGANNAAVIMSNSVIALNHVHHTNSGTLQGDGIEIKQGSWGNWVAENVIHDTKYPALLLYGTGGEAVNLVERNVLIGSNDNVLQVQGEAIVRNNLIMNGATGFHSHDHQGQTRDLQFVHNTIVNTGRATRMSNWNGRPGMVFANNAVYSQSSNSIYFPGGSAGVDISGNVVLGSVSGASVGYTAGNGLGDFVDASWDGASSDVTPAPGSPLIGAGDGAFAVEEDIFGDERQGALDTGCVDAD